MQRRVLEERSDGYRWRLGRPAYDAAGNMTTMPQPNDPESAFTCVYDGWNRLVKVLDGESTVATYRYDGLNRRVAKTVAGTPDVTTDFYYSESWQVLEERVASGQPGPSAPAVQYAWDLRYIDAPAVRFYDANTDGDYEDPGDNVLYYCNDANMNVTALIDATPASQTPGQVLERYAYDPYGRVIVLNGAAGADPDVTGEVHEWDRDAGGSDVSNEVLYCGYRYDTDTGLYQVRHRYYYAGGKGDRLLFGCTPQVAGG